jgi:Mg-chelatase subunit ChlD
MSGLAVAIAAVAASAVMLAAAGRHDAGVIAFSSEVSELHPPGSARPPGELVGELVALRGHGTTDLAAALRAAARQLAGCRADERVVILLSDCLRTAGGDPAGALAGIDRLQVLCPLPSGPDHRAEQAAAALARRGGGISQPVRGLADVGPALTRVLA